MSEIASLGWLHKDVQDSILSAVAGGKDDATFIVRSDAAIAEVHQLSLPTGSPVFEIIGHSTSPLKFKFASTFAASCFSRDMIAKAAVGLDFKPSKYWGKLHKRAKLGILRTLLMDGTNCFPDVAAVQRIVANEDVIAEMFSKGVLLPATNAPQGCQISGILVEYALSRCGLQQEGVAHTTPVVEASHPGVSREMILRDCEYLAGTFRSFDERERHADRSENVFNHIVFWTSVWVVESSAAKFSSIIPHDNVGMWGANKELVASRHAVKFLSDKKPVLSEVRNILEAWCTINSDFLSFSAVFFNGRLITTTHTEDFLMGVRFEDGDKLTKTPEYPYLEVADYVIRVLDHHHVELPSTAAEDSFLRSANWDGISVYPITSVESGHSKAFVGVRDMSATSLLMSCQSLLTFVAYVAPADRRPVSAWVTFKQQYLVVHSIRKTLEALSGEMYVTNQARKKINGILDAGFVTDFSMRNDLLHYDISEWTPDENQDDFGMSQHYHQRSYAELRSIMQGEATRFSSEMNKWGLRERHAGIPLISSWFKKRKPNLLERVLRKVATDPIDKIPVGRLGVDTP